MGLSLLRQRVLTWDVAMGNSVAWKTRACGLDVHRPDHFVPVPGVWYLADPCPPPQLRELFRRLWPELRDPATPLLILNGIWGALPEVRSTVASSAAKRHVLIADEPGVAIRPPNWRAPINVITVGANGSHGLQISIEVLGGR